MPLISVLAQAAVAASPQAGVIAYPPAFFAEARPANAYEMVVRVPGFTFDGGDSVRGFEGAAGNVLVNGRRPASKTDGLDQVLVRIPVSQVERIELIRGGAPGVDMQGKSVLVNVVRKEGGGIRGVVSVADGVVVDDGRQIPSYRLEANGERAGHAWEVSLRQGRGLDDGAGPGPGVRVAPDGRVLERSRIDALGDAWQTTAVASYELPLAGGRLKINGRLFSDRYRYNETAQITAPALRTTTSTLRVPVFDTELGGRYSRAFGARIDLESIVLRQTHDEDVRDFFDPGAGPASNFDLRRRSSETIVRSTLKFRQTETLSWELGAEGALNRLNSRAAYAEGGVDQALPAANVRVEEKRAEAFLKTTWRVSPKLTLEGAIKQEVSRISSSGDVGLSKDLAFAKPRLALSWSPDSATQLRLRLERTVDQLDFDDFVADASLNQGQVTAGNPDLDPEQAWVGEAALERRFTWGPTVVLSLRHYELRDVVDVGPVFAADGAVFDHPENIGGGTKDEAQVTLTLPLDRLGLKRAELRGDTTWRRSRVTDPTTGRKRSISGSQPLSWEAHFTHDVASWRLNWGVDVYGAWRETYYRANQVEVRKLKTFVTTFAEYKPRTNLSLRLEVQNITARGFRNTRYAYDGARGAAPLAQITDRDLQFGRVVWVRVRRTFG